MVNVQVGRLVRRIRGCIINLDLIASVRIHPVNRVLILRQEINVVVDNIQKLSGSPVSHQLFRGQVRVFAIIKLAAAIGVTVFFAHGKKALIQEISGSDSFLRISGTGVRRRQGKYEKDPADQKNDCGRCQADQFSGQAFWPGWRSVSGSITAASGYCCPRMLWSTPDRIRLY